MQYVAVPLELIKRIDSEWQDEPDGADLIEALSELFEIADQYDKAVKLSRVEFPR